MEDSPGSLASAIVDVEGKKVSFATPERVVYYVFPSQGESGGNGGIIIRGILIAVAIVLFLIIMLNVPISSCLRNFSESMTVRQSDTPDNLLDHEVKKLGDAGWHLYTMPGCHFCEEQMDVLGGSYDSRHVCGQSNKASDAVSIDDCAGISGFPYWKNSNTGEIRTGLQSADDLRRM